jgi:MFS transporter, ACS family, tartrate transporter
MPPVLEDHREAAVIAQVSRRLLPFLFLLYVVAFLDRINVGFAFLQMRTQLGFTDEVYGFGAGLFFAGYFFFQLPSNLILMRVGSRRWIAGLMVVWGLVSASMIFVRTPHGFYLLRFMLGAAEAGFFPGMVLYLKDWFPARARARALAWFMTAGPISGVVGGPISGALLGMHHIGLQGWQWLFVMEGGPAILLGGVVLIYLTEKPQAADWLSTPGRAWLIETLERERQENTARGRASLSAGFLSGTVWLLVLVYFGINTCAYGMMLWLPSVIHGLAGFSDFEIGLLTAIPNFAAAVMMVLVGRHSDKSAERRWHMALSALAGAIGLVLTAYTHSPIPVLIGTSLAIGGAFAMDGPFWAMPTSLLTGTAAAAGVAVINSLGNLGGFFGPAILGWVRGHTGGFRGGLLVIAAALLGAGFTALLVRAHADEAAVK